MTTGSTTEVFDQNLPGNRSSGAHRLLLAAFGVLGLVSLAALTGCQEPATPTPLAQINNQPEVLTIHEGDGLKISFPSAPNLDTTQQVRRDGRITLSMVGEVLAAGLTPAALEQELVKLYAAQLVSKEVSVTVVSSSFSIYVSGAVLRPGKIMSDRPISALEAIMEAGGFDNVKANMRAVVVTRQEGGQYKNYTLDLKQVLEGKQTQPFLLKASDVVYVPERFSMF
jgi:polysaccharide export outer membrane protein